MNKTLSMSSRMGVVVALALSAGAAGAAELAEPPVFASRDGALDLLMIAEPAPARSLLFAPPAGPAVNPVGWVYKICPRPPSGNQCPAGSPMAADYGGVRLALRQGDTLKIRFVNRLPALDPRKLAHVTEPGHADLFRNPTNLHLHGLQAPAREPSANDPTFGDYVFVSIYNSANGAPAPQTAHAHGESVMDVVDYRIDIPANHPSGLFWFHPHVHGLALNQLSSGLSGIFTVGAAGDYARSDASGAPFPSANVRHLILKDMQVLAAGDIQFDSGTAGVESGEVLNQQDSAFCAQFPVSALENRKGSCPGRDNSASGGNNYAGGQWYFTVNGQQFPTIRMTSPDGEIWRLTNASGSVSYRLQLANQATAAPMIVQLVSVDGAAVSLPADTPAGAMSRIGGARFRAVPCPGAQFGKLRSPPVCVSELVMMPSARAEVWVAYRDATGQLGPAPAGAGATLEMTGLTMGSGDAWPAVDLAEVLFAQAGPRRHMASAMNVVADAFAAAPPRGAGASPKSVSPPPAGCRALPNGHRRRVFFGLEDLSDGGSFGLGYEEVDERGVPVPGTQAPVSRFDPMRSPICLPLGKGQTPVHETWELVQLSTENHNFHIHQARFRELAPSGGAGVVMDNIPLGVAAPASAISDQVMNNQSGVCAIEQWRSGQCASQPVFVDIAFSEMGEFVYHCHILEHEDGGMMAKIRVVPSSR